MNRHNHNYRSHSYHRNHPHNNRPHNNHHRNYHRNNYMYLIDMSYFHNLVRAYNTHHQIALWHLSSLLHLRLVSSSSERKIS